MVGADTLPHYSSFEQSTSCRDLNVIGRPVQIKSITFISFDASRISINVAAIESLLNTLSIASSQGE